MAGRIPFLCGVDSGALDEASTWMVAKVAKAGKMGDVQRVGDLKLTGWDRCYRRPIVKVLVANTTKGVWEEWLVPLFPRAKMESSGGKRKKEKKSALRQRLCAGRFLRSPIWMQPTSQLSRPEI